MRSPIAYTAAAWVRRPNLRVTNLTYMIVVHLPCASAVSLERVLVGGALSQGTIKQLGTLEQPVVGLSTSEAPRL